MDIPPARSWVDPRVRPGHFAIEGEGEFALEPIRGGERIKVLGGALVNQATMRRVSTSGRRFSALRVDADLHLLMAWDDPAARGNHSCNPNAWLDSEFVVVARRDIAEGEEITTDYATMTVDDDWRLNCRCGSHLCRRVVTGGDWRLPELQERYRGHFVPWIEQLMAHS
ncbi:MAG: SET domain-containing protein [Dehalococcoidia bacterium]